LHLYSSTTPSFLCKKIQIYAGFLFIYLLTHEENIFSFISMWGHIDPEDQKFKHFFYIPSEQSNQAQFFFVCVCV